MGKYKAEAPSGVAGHLLGGAGGLCSWEGAREDKEDRVLAENLALTQVAKGSVVWALGSSVGEEDGCRGGGCSRRLGGPVSQLWGWGEVIGTL